MVSGKYSSALNVEEKFQCLLHILAASQSPRIKLSHLQQFLCFLSNQENPYLYQSYYQELLPYFVEFITEETLLYRSVDFLIELGECAGALKDVCSMEIESVGFASIFDNLSKSLAQTYFYLGEWKAGLKVLDSQLELESWDEFLNGIDGSSELSNLERIKAIIAEEGNRESQLQESLERIAKEWTEIVESAHRDKVWILLVEQDITHTGIEKLTVGTIQPLALKAEVRPQDVDEDLILFNNRSLSLDDVLYYQAQDAIHCVRGLHVGSLSSRKKYYKLTYSFPDKTSIYTGDSLGLGMGLLNIFSVSNLVGHTYRYCLKQDLTVTGSLDILGNLRPIGEQSLRIKLQTLFYSPFSCLLLSERNKDESKKILSPLTESYPNRRLAVFGEDTLKDCVHNEKIVIKKKTPFAKRIISKKQWKYKFLTWGLALITIFIGIWQILSRDTNPAKFEIDGKYMRVYNLSGKELWRYNFGYELIADHYATDVRNPKYLVEDLDSDGENEVVIGTSEIDKHISGTIYYFESDGELKWEFHNHPVITLGDELKENYFVNRIIHNKDFDKDGYDELFVVFGHYLFFPNRLMIFDLDGNVLGEYWNSGHIYDIQFIDIDKDGTDEILFGGTNNDYNTGILGVLEYDQLHGHSPQDKNAYTPKGVPTGTERYYIRFPSASYIIPNAKEIRDVVDRLIDLGENLFSCSIIAGEKSGSLLYKMDYQFNVHHFDFSDDFYGYYRKKYGKELYEDFLEDEIQEYFKTLEFWDGDQWVTEPTENKYWRGGETEKGGEGERE